MASHEISVEPDISAVAPLVEWIEGRCRENGLADDITFKMALILEEAVTNVINHAFADLPPPHMIRVRLDIAIERIVAEVVDNGHPFDPLARPDPELSRSIETPTGRPRHPIDAPHDRSDRVPAQQWRQSPRPRKGPALISS